MGSLASAEPEFSIGAHINITAQGAGDWLMLPEMQTGRGVSQHRLGEGTSSPSPCPQASSFLQVPVTSTAWIPVPSQPPSQFLLCLLEEDGLKLEISVKTHIWAHLRGS